MPARDIYHDCVKRALLKDGWIVTHDPLTLKWGRKEMYVDLGAEKLLAAEKAGQRIAVEIKSFLGPSEMQDLKEALGQYVLYHDVLAHTDPERRLYLAVNEAVYYELFEEPIGQLLLENHRIRLLVFDTEQERIVAWIP